MISYWYSLRKSIIAIKLAKEDIAKKDKDAGVDIILKENDVEIELTENEKQLMDTQLNLQECLLTKLDQKVRTNSDVISAYLYFVSLINPK